MKIMKIWLSWMVALTFFENDGNLTKSNKDLWNLENDVNLVKSNKDLWNLENDVNLVKSNKDFNILKWWKIDYVE